MNSVQALLEFESMRASSTEEFDTARYRAVAANVSTAMKQQRESEATKRYVWEGAACCDDQRVNCSADCDRRRFKRNVW